jgi:hypothetical protein
MIVSHQAKRALVVAELPWFKPVYYLHDQSKSRVERISLLTGTLLGVLVDAVATRWMRVKINIPQQGMLIGIVAGIVIWLALFRPITTLIIQPYILTSLRY